MAAGPILYVEGKDDRYVIGELMLAHGVELSRPRKVFGRPIIEEKESVEQLLTGIDLAIEASGGHPVGFVLDADAHVSLERRWQAISERLRSVGVTLDPSPSPEGFIGVAPDGTPVGIWLMPDNVRDGTLETFLADLVADDDLLLPVAKRIVNEITAIERRFPRPHESKAVLHTWLAWQATPGQPYGLAVKSRAFKSDRPPARAFVE